MQYRHKQRQFVLREADYLAAVSENGRFRMPQLSARTAAQGMNSKVTRSILGELAEERRVAIFAARNRTEYTTPAARPTFLWLYERAAEVVDNTYKPNRRGRRRSDAPRDISRINAKHRERIWTVLRHIARHVGGLGRNASVDQVKSVLAQLGGEYLVWDPQAGAGGRGDWRRALELLDAATGGATPEQAGALRMLLDLAATHAWITRTVRHDPTYSPIPPEWTEVYDEWREVLHGRLRRHATKAALLTLLESCAELGVNDPRTAEWDDITEAIEERFRADSTHTVQTKADVRAVYRALRAAGVIRGPQWNGWLRQRGGGYSAISGASRRIIADTYGADGSPPLNWEWRTWEWPGCEHVTGLIDGKYGLRIALRAMTADAALIGSERLPDRALYPNEPVRRPVPRSEIAWSAGTTRVHLGHLSYLAGWMSKSLNIDWAREENDLSVLLDLQHVQAFVTWMVNNERKRYLSRIAKTCARLGSPILESLAQDAGDTHVEHSAHLVSMYLSSPNGVVMPGAKRPVKSVLTVCRETTAERIDRQKAESARSEKAWTRGKSTAEYAIEQKERIRDAALDEFEERWGELIGQHMALLDGRHSRDREWAIWTERRLFWLEQCLVPLRPATLRRACIGHRKHDPEFRTIWAEYPPEVMKGRAWFRPAYIGPRSVEERYRRLYALYVAPGGALEVLLGHPAQAEDPFWPNESGNRYVEVRQFSRWMSSLVERYETVLAGGITAAELRGARVLSAKFFRHSVAKRLVAQGRSSIAAKLLHHTSTTMVERVYGALDERDIDASEIAACAAAGAARRVEREA